MKIYKITDASKYLGVSINTLNMIEKEKKEVVAEMLMNHYASKMDELAAKERGEYNEH